MQASLLDFGSVYIHDFYNVKTGKANDFSGRAFEKVASRGATPPRRGSYGVHLDFSKRVR
jgi:hypothetical protein